MAIERMNPLSLRKLLMTLVSLAAIAVAVPTAATPIRPIERAIPRDRLPLLAQVERTQNLCRRVTAQWGSIVREAPNPDSAPKGRIDYQGEVTLVFNFEEIPGPEGDWVEIAFPVKGYVLSGNLELCSQAATADSNASTATEAPAENTVSEIPVPPPNSTAENPIPVETPPAENPVPVENPVPDPENIPDGPFCRQVNGLVTPQGLAVRAEPAGNAEYIGGIPRNGRVQLMEDYQYIPDKNGANISWVKIVAPIEGFISVNSLIRCL